MDVAAVGIVDIHAVKYSQEKERVLSKTSKTLRMVSIVVLKKVAYLGGGTRAISMSDSLHFTL